MILFPHELHDGSIHLCSLLLQSTLRKRSSASGLVPGNPVKRMKPNGIESSISSNSSDKPPKSANSRKHSPPRSSASEKISHEQAGKEMSVDITDDRLSPDYQRYSGYVSDVSCYMYSL